MCVYPGFFLNSTLNFFLFLTEIILILGGRLLEISVLAL
jgi:hypothetical protein